MSFCKVCNLPFQFCPCKKTGLKTVLKIILEPVKKHILITKLFSSLDKEEFKELKRKLGCGGKIYKDFCMFQGDQRKKLKAILLKKGYIFSKDG